MKHLPLSLALAAVLAAPLTVAGDPPDRQELVQQEVENLLLRLSESGALPGPEDSPLVVQSPPQVRHDLGAVIDLALVEGGAPVLAVTPGGTAERIGLQPGDRLLALNQLRLGQGTTRSALREAVEANDGRIELEVARGGRTLALAGEADAVQTPEYSLTVAPSTQPEGCGRISTFTSMPRTRELFPIALFQIDGREMVHGLPDIRVKAGKHVLKLSEGIDRKEFNNIELVRMNQLRYGNRQYKYFEIEVKPNTTYRLAAKLLAGINRDIIGNNYWAPVVWEEYAQRCP